MLGETQMSSGVKQARRSSLPFLTACFEKAALAVTVFVGVIMDPGKTERDPALKTACDMGAPIRSKRDRAMEEKLALTEEWGKRFP